MPKFWIGFIVGVVTLKALYFLYDIIQGIILHYQMKDYFKDD